MIEKAVGNLLEPGSNLISVLRTHTGKSPQHMEPSAVETMPDAELAQVA